LAENEAFLLSDPKTREIYAKAYDQSRALYYKSQPSFKLILATLAKTAQIEGV